MSQDNDMRLVITVDVKVSDYNFLDYEHGYALIALKMIRGELPWPELVHIEAKAIGRPYSTIKRKDSCCSDALVIAGQPTGPKTGDYGICSTCGHQAIFNGKEWMHNPTL